MAASYTPWKFNGFRRKYIDGVFAGIVNDSNEIAPELNSGTYNATVSMGLLLPLYPGNPQAAFTVAHASAKALLADGAVGRVTIDCEDRIIDVPPPGLTIPANSSNITLYRAKFRALEGDWAETDATDIAFWNKYQTVTADTKPWSLRKPLLTILGACKAYIIKDCYFDGQGRAGTRQAAGFRSKGTNNSDSLLSGGKIVDCESYCVFTGSDTQNTGAIDIEGVECKPNGGTTASIPQLERTSYGFVCSSNDQHWVGITGSNAHCTLLVAEKGSTTFFEDVDFFNGASWDPGSFPHRNIEYRGNSCTFTPGRLGNGQFHVFNPDIVVGPIKFGVTDGSGFLPPGYGYFKIYSTGLLSDMKNFVLNFGNEVPYALKTTVNWFEFVTQSGHTWDIDIVGLATSNGYTQTLPSGKSEFSQVTNNPRIMSFRSSVPTGGGYLAMFDVATTKENGWGVIGETLATFIDKVATWIWGGADLKPADDAGGTTTAPTGASIGSATKRVASTYTVLLRLGDGDRVIATGTGTPEGVFTAKAGSLFLRTNGGAGTTLYVKESGTGNTGWIGK